MLEQFFEEELDNILPCEAEEKKEEKSVYRVSSINWNPQNGYQDIQEDSSLDSSLSHSFENSFNQLYENCITPSPIKPISFFSINANEMDNKNDFNRNSVDRNQDQWLNDYEGYEDYEDSISRQNVSASIEEENNNETQYVEQEQVKHIFAYLDEHKSTQQLVDTDDSLDVWYNKPETTNVIEPKSDQKIHVNEANDIAESPISQFELYQQLYAEQWWYDISERSEMDMSYYYRNIEPITSKERIMKVIKTSKYNIKKFVKSKNKRQIILNKIENATIDVMDTGILVIEEMNDIMTELKERAIMITKLAHCAFGFVCMKIVH